MECESEYANFWLQKLQKIQISSLHIFPIFVQTFQWLPPVIVDWNCSFGEKGVGSVIFFIQMNNTEGTWPK